MTPVYTAHGRQVSTNRVDGPSWRVSKNVPEFSGRQLGPWTRAVNLGSGNRPLLARDLFYSQMDVLPDTHSYNRVKAIQLVSLQLYKGICRKVVRPGAVQSHRVRWKSCHQILWPTSRITAKLHVVRIIVNDLHRAMSRSRQRSQPRAKGCWTSMKVRQYLVGCWLGSELSLVCTWPAADG